VRCFAALIPVMLTAAWAQAQDEAAPSRLAALVAGRPVTLADLEQRIRLRNVEPGKAAREDWDHALESAVNRALFLAAAEREEIKVPDEDLARALEATRSGPGAKEHQREAALLGLTRDQEVERVRESLLIQELLRRKLGAKLVVTPDAIREWYEKNKDLLASPEVRAARVITLRPQRKEDAAATNEKLTGLRRRAMSGEDFAALARERSQDPWAGRGGRLDPMQRGLSGSIFAERVFALGKPGDVSEPFETNAGLHLLRLEDITPKKVPSFEEAQPAVRERVFQELSAKLLAELAGELRRKTPVRVFWSEIPWPKN